MNNQEQIEIIDNKILELKEKEKNAKGTDCEVYTRIVGYLRPVSNWNRGKQEEYLDRVMFSADKFGHSENNPIQTTQFNLGEMKNEER